LESEFNHYQDVRSTTHKDVFLLVCTIIYCYNPQCFDWCVLVW